jgi:DNA-binding beta-propeller fold protein YncE
LAVWLLAAAVAGCGDLKAQISGADFRGDDGNTNPNAYPYYLAIGGGLSETISILKVREGPTFEIFQNVAPTDMAINDAVATATAFYTVCSLSNSVVVYDLNLNVIREAEVGAGANPMNLALAAGQTGWVSDFLANDVRLVNLGPGPAGQAVQATVALPDSAALPHDAGVTTSWARPDGVALVGGTLFVALSNLSAQWTPAGPGQLALVDTATATLAGVVTLQGRDPIGVMYDDARKLVWVCSAGDYHNSVGFVGDGLLEGVDPTTQAVVRRIAVQGAPFVPLIAPSGLAYLENGLDGEVLVVDLDAGRQLPSIDLRLHVPGSGLSYISGLALDPAGRLYAVDFNSDYLYVIDPAQDNKVIYQTIVNDGPNTLTFLP